ncbi:hypothetical protein [Streptomyces sp. 3N207]
MKSAPTRPPGEGEVAEVAVRLGVWRSNVRFRRSGVGPEQLTVLDELGV